MQWLLGKHCCPQLERMAPQAAPQALVVEGAVEQVALVMQRWCWGLQQCSGGEEEGNK
jgi:hypothetical protein